MRQALTQIDDKINGLALLMSKQLGNKNPKIAIQAHKDLSLLKTLYETIEENFEDELGGLYETFSYYEKSL